MAFRCDSKRRRDILTKEKTMMSIKERILYVVISSIVAGFVTAFIWVALGWIK